MLAAPYTHSPIQSPTKDNKERDILALYLTSKAFTPLVIKFLKDANLQDLSQPDHTVSDLILNWLETMRKEPLDKTARHKVKENIQNYRTVLHQKRQRNEPTQMEEYSPTRPSYPLLSLSPKKDEVQQRQPYTPTGPECGKCLYQCCHDCSNKVKCSCHHTMVSVSDNEECSSGSDESDDSTGSSVPTPLAFSSESESSESELTPMQQIEEHLRRQRQAAVEEELRKQTSQNGPVTVTV
jgi:hypothetical protein